jgi:hypothetical protein
MTVSRNILGHCGVRAHLKRFSIVDESMCVCLEAHETSIISYGNAPVFRLKEHA